MPLSRTKLKRPPLAKDYVARSELLAQLEQGRDRPLTLVSTPAGYGKSTLLSAWLQETEVASAWLSLEARDDGFHSLASGVVDAIDTAVPGELQRTRSWLQEGEPPSAEALASCLVEEVAELNTPLVLVLDDYHIIRDREAHDFVAAVIDFKSGVLHLAIATRMDPPFPLVRLRAGAQITEVRQEDLRFSQEEAEEFLTKALGREVDTETARTLEEKTEGWPVGLRLGALTLRRAKDTASLLGGLPTGGRFVTDYLVTEVLKQQTPIIQEYLLRTSVLDRFCAALCDAVLEVDLGQEVETGTLDGEAFISLAERANVFLVPIDDEGRWYRYHQLFRELLRHQLDGRNTEAEIRTLHETASSWLERRGFLTEAIELTFHDPALTARLLSRHRYDLMNREQWHRLDQWLRRLPPESIDGSPELLLLKAWTLEHIRHFAEEIQLGRRAAELLADADPEDARSLLGEVEAILAFEAYLSRNGPGAIEHAERALDLLDPDADIIRGYAVVMLSASYQMVGDLERARRVVQEQMRPEAGPPPTYDGRLVAALMFVDWMAGDARQLAIDSREAYRIGREGSLAESLGFGNYFLGVAAYEVNDLATAEEHLTMVLRGLPYGDPWNLISSGFVLAAVRESQGKSDEARRLSSDLSTRALQARHPGLLPLCRAFEADLAVRQGRVAEAVRWANEHEPGPVMPPYRWYNPHLTYARVRIAQGSDGWGEAETFLARLREIYGSIHSTRALIEVLALQSILQQALGNGKVAQEKLAESLRLAEPGGCVRLFIDLGPDMRALLRKLGPRTPSLGFAGRILAAFAESSLGISRGTPALTGAADSDSGRLLATELTHRELEILDLLAERLSNKEIAALLRIKAGTVKTHANSLYRKLNVNGRREVVAKAEALGILRPR